MCKASWGKVGRVSALRKKGRWKQEQLLSGTGLSVTQPDSGALYGEGFVHNLVNFGPLSIIEPGSGRAKDSN